MGFWGPQTCPWLKIVTNFFFLGGATELKIWDLAPRPKESFWYFAGYVFEEVISFKPPDPLQMGEQMEAQS